MSSKRFRSFFISKFKVLYKFLIFSTCFTHRCSHAFGRKLARSQTVADFHNLYGAPHTITMRRTGYATRIYIWLERILVRKPEGRKVVGRHRRRLKGNNKRILNKQNVKANETPCYIKCTQCLQKFRDSHKKASLFNEVSPLKTIFIQNCLNFYCCRNVDTWTTWEAIVQHWISYDIIHISSIIWYSTEENGACNTHRTGASLNKTVQKINKLLQLK